MPFDRFTERSLKVVDLASREARRTGNDSVDTVHLLVGMLHEGKGVAASVLTGFGIDANSVLEADKLMESEPDATLPEVESSCMAEAKWFGHNYVGTEHLLLGVCSLADCKAARLLASIDMPPVELCQEALKLLGHGHEWNRWLTDHPKMASDR